MRPSPVSAERNPALGAAATIAGADDFVEVTLWGEQHQAFLRRFFPYEFGIPSHDTMCDVEVDPIGWTGIGVT
jgi:hypothetical protein